MSELCARPRRRTVALLALFGIALLATSTATSSAAFSSTSANPTGTVTAAADWTPPTVTLSVADVLRGTATLTAQAADAETGVKDVTIAWMPDEGTTWTTVCVRTAAPYTCTLATTSIPDGYIDVRAVATDNAGYSTTTIVDGVLVDNTAPTASLTAIASQLNGSVTLGATVSDTGSGVASVLIQYVTANGSNWATACTATAAPWTCRFDTTKVPDGSYDFRAVVIDVAGNTTTTALIRNRTIDNRVASVSVDPVDPFVRGVETVTATPYSTAGVVSVRLEYSRVGTSTWTTLCTATAAPWGCDWNTATVVDGDYLLRAVMVDGAAKTTTSATVATRVDNSATRGFDVQAANGGGTLGRIDVNDAVTLTYTRQMRLTSILAGWTGTAQTVTVRFRDGGLLGLSGTDDTMDVFTTSALNTPVYLGSVNLKGDFVKAGRTVLFTATMTHQTVTANGVPASAVTLRMNATTANKHLRTSNASPTMVWTPSGSAVDVDGVATSASPVTELGAVDRDL